MRLPRLLAWIWPRRLSRQLWLIISLLLVMALGLLGGYTAHEQTALEYRAAQDMARGMARHVAISSAGLILTNSLDELEDVVRRAADFKSVRALRVLQPNGRVLVWAEHAPDQSIRMQYSSSQSSLLNLPPDGEAVVQEDGAHALLVVWHPVKAGSTVGWVRVDYDIADLTESRARIWRNTAVVAAMAVAGAMLLLWLFLWRPVHDLARARHFAVKMVNGHGEQLPEGDGPMEVMELTRALNQASQIISRQMHQLDDNLKQMTAHQQQLAIQNDQLGAIFTLSRDGLLTVGRDGMVQFVNHAFMALCQIAPDEVIGRSLTDVAARIKAQARDPEAFKGLQSDESWTLQLNGPVPRVLSFHAQTSDSASVARVIYVCDVTRQHQLDQMKSDFLSMAAHELRTPMVSLYGFTELMLKREMGPEKRHELLSIMYRQSQAMVTILNELLDLARIESRQGQELQLSDAELGDLVAQTVHAFKPPDGRPLPIVAAPDRPMHIQVDVGKLQQALLNVLSNAYKYSPAGGEVHIGFAVSRSSRGQSWWGVEIRDQGMGLSPENLARMGERFFRVDKSGNIPGTGLGVAIVKELLALMGGRMHIDSELGVGTAVTLWLPSPVKDASGAGADGSQPA